MSDEIKVSITSEPGPSENRWRFTDAHGNVQVLRQGQEREAAQKIEDALRPLSPGKRDELLSKLNTEHKRHQSERAVMKAKEAALLDELAAVRDFKATIDDWEARGLRLERPAGSAAHRLAEAMKAGRVRAYTEDFTAELKRLGMTKAVPFVIEHDWATALSGATDFAEGEHKLPFESVLFEFRVSGFHVCVLASDYFRAILIECGKNWLISAMNDVTGFGHDLPGLLDKNVRAVCIALDAEVAITDTVRAPERLNRQRLKKGASPLLDYHVIRLSRITRAAPLPDDESAGLETRRKRLHFVRGHYRHFENHKTWIKWHLRGDIDLGFIDKHYRL